MISMPIAYKRMPAPDDPIAPARGVINGLILGLVLWGLIGGCAWWAFAAQGGYRQYLRPRCEWCGTTGAMLNRLNVHHPIPQHVRPDLADGAGGGNAQTLCRQCHWVLGHRRNWQDWNPGVQVVARAYGRAPWYDGKQEVRPLEGKTP